MSSSTTTTRQEPHPLPSVQASPPLLLRLPDDLLLMIAETTRDLGSHAGDAEWWNFEERINPPQEATIPTRALSNLRLVNKKFADLGARAKLSLSRQEVDCFSGVGRLLIRPTPRSLEHCFAIANHPILSAAVRCLNVRLLEFDFIEIPEDVFPNIVRHYDLDSTESSLPEESNLSRRISSDRATGTTLKDYRRTRVLQDHVLRRVTGAEYLTLISAFTCFNNLFFVSLTSLEPDDHFATLDPTLDNRSHWSRVMYLSTITTAVTSAGCQLDKLIINSEPHLLRRARRLDTSLGCPSLLHNLKALWIGAGLIDPHYEGEIIDNVRYDVRPWDAVLREAKRVESLKIKASDTDCWSCFFDIGLSKFCSPNLVDLELYNLTISNVVLDELLSKHSGTLKSVELGYLMLEPRHKWRNLLHYLKHGLRLQKCYIYHLFESVIDEWQHIDDVVREWGERFEEKGTVDIGYFVLGYKPDHPDSPQAVIETVEDSSGPGPRDENGVETVDVVWCMQILTVGGPFPEPDLTACLPQKPDCRYTSGT